MFTPGSRFWQPERSSSGQAPEQISCSANGVRSVSGSGWRSHCGRQLSCPMNQPRGDACVVTGTSRSLITHSPPLTDARRGICRATNSPRPEPEHESYARVASAAHRGVVPTIEMSAHDTHTHTHADNTHTHTHTRASARSDLCVFRGLHAAVRRDSVGPEIVSNFSMRAQREGKHTLGNGRSGSAPRAEGVGACTTRSDRVEFGASRTHCNGRPRFLCRQRKSGGGTEVNGGE